MADEEKIKALGEELRTFRKSISDEKTLIGFNMAVAICNKYLGENNNVFIRSNYIDKNGNIYQENNNEN